jgi:hypothetical protein
MHDCAFMLPALFFDLPCRLYTAMLCDEGSHHTPAPLTRSVYYTDCWCVQDAVARTRVRQPAHTSNDGATFGVRVPHTSDEKARLRAPEAEWHRPAAAAAC